jgi:hypothetical protein
MMATLIDPAIFSGQSPDEAPLADRLEAVARSIMAARVRLKQQPGTHGEQADLVVELDCVLDRYLEVVADDGHRS